MKMDRKIGWGILGAADIARKNWRAIALSSNGTVIGAASRDPERCRKFIADCQAEAPMQPAPRAFASYEELLACKDIDAVYIPLPTGVRKQWVLRAAAAGKHIVCEKPCAPSVADLREMLQACREHQVQFMDGVMFMHSQRLESMHQALHSEPAIGNLRRVTSAFSFYAAPEFFTGNIRTHADLEPLGCLGDLGWYCLRFSLWAKQWKMPEQVTGRIHAEVRRPDSSSSVPTEFSGELFFADGTSAGFFCSFLTGIHQWVNVAGTHGYVEMDDFALPFAGEKLEFRVRDAAFRVKGCDFRMEPSVRNFSVAEHAHGHVTSQETRLFRNFAELVKTGTRDEHWPEIAFKTQIVTNACLESARCNSQPIPIKPGI